jgi:hypothetical protein
VDNDITLYTKCEKQRPKGRPPGAEKIRITLKLRPDVDDRPYDAAGRLGMTKSDYVDRALRLIFELDEGRRQRKTTTPLQ